VRTAVDANILLEILVGSEESAAQATSALRSAELNGSLVTSVVCYAEIAGWFPSSSQAESFLATFDCLLEHLDRETAFLAGRLHQEYRRRDGQQKRILPDFLIAAHAQLYADRILTRDKRFFGESFPRLKAVSPADLA